MAVSMKDEHHHFTHSATTIGQCTPFAASMELRVANETLNDLLIFIAAHGNFAKPDISLKLVARRINLSSRHIGRLFRKSMGQSFRGYICDLRIAKATELLLLTPQHNIKAVVAMVGYKSRSHFDKDFRDRLGCTPAQFQKRYPRFS